MATSDFKEKKRELNKITIRIDQHLYEKILTAVSAPLDTIQKFSTAKLYYIDQLLNKSFDPWHTAVCIRGFGFPELANELEQFAITFKFQALAITNINPETAILELLKYLKAHLTHEELLSIRDTPTDTFESIFANFLATGELSPTLENLKEKLKEENREDLAADISIHYNTILSMDTAKFNRTVQLCLDTLDTNIFLILQELKSALVKQHSDFHLLDEDLQTADIEHNYIDLTFTKEVDTRTLPLTEGSDAELKTLINNARLGSKEKTAQYVKALSEINSYSNSGKLISVIGHPGTGKTLFCRKLINQYSNTETDTHRYVLLITCRNSDWHILEDQSMSTPGNKLDKLKLFLQVLIPTFSKQDELAEIIITSEGKGLLLIIDSFDEFPQYQKFDATLLYQLLSRNIISQSTLLITSRPGAWNQLLRSYGNKFKFDHSWQLIGFSVDQRDQFIDKMLTPEKIITLKQVLNTKPELNLLTLVPINISLITGLVKHSVYISDLRTLTDVYTRLVLYTLDKQHKRLNKQSAGINSYEEMPKEMKNELLKLAKLSYSGLQNRQITFPAIEMNIDTQFSKGLGLFHTIKVTSKQLTVIDYLSCPHLTLQEYLAALHLSHKPTNEIINTIQDIFSTNSWPAMKVCIRFVCGLLKNGQQVIINILITKLHLKPAPAFNCELFNMDNDYTILYAHITDSHLSIIPYILETEDPSILSAYYTQLSSTTSTCPHFYLYTTISPVELYSLCECFTLLPANSSISTLHISIDLLDSTQLLMLAQAMATIQLHKLIFTLDGTDETRDISAIEQLPNSIADISYELQQLHDTNRHTLINEFQQYADQPTLQKIYKLRYILLSSKLTAASLTLLTDTNLLKKLHGFINTISNQTSKQPEHIYYEFIDIQFTDASMNAQLLNILSPTATYVLFWDCYYPIEWARHIISQPNLMHIYTLHSNTDYLKELNNYLLAPEVLLSRIGKQTFKGLNLDLRLSIQESIVYEFIKTQHSLEEIRFVDTTNLLEALTAIQHITTLKALDILPIEDTPDNAVQCQSLFLDILSRNHQSLSYVAIFSYCVISLVRLTELLSLCSNLQAIQFIYCLTPQLMAPVTTAINQLHSLVYINMLYNAITDEGISILSQTLSPNSNIRSIIINTCQLTVSSIPAIINIIHTCYNLQRLNLRNNDFENETNDLKKLCKKRNIKLHL